MIRHALRRVPERTLTPAPNTRAQRHRRTLGSCPPTRKAARRSRRCVEAERESRGFAIIHSLQFDGQYPGRCPPPAFFSTTVVTYPSTIASSSNVDRTRRRDARKEAHMRSARFATRRPSSRGLGIGASRCLASDDDARARERARDGRERHCEARSASRGARGDGASERRRLVTYVDRL